MTPRRKKRLLLIGAGLAALVIAVALVLSAFEENMVFFVTPSEVVTGEVNGDREVRIGGLVEEGSVKRIPGTTRVQFRITDQAESLTVLYDGILPDLFREGQGVVAQGVIGRDGVFEAHQVLARHDETYMPPEAAEALERAGHTNAPDY